MVVFENESNSSAGESAELMCIQPHVFFRIK